MISISTITGSSAGNIVLRNYGAEPKYKSSARLSRSATLDGGSVFVHSGVSASDRDLAVECRLTETEASNLKTMYENHTLVSIAFHEGFFVGYIRACEIGRDGVARLNLYIKEKVA
jgi:hypothetical protein